MSLKKTSRWPTYWRLILRVMDQFLEATSAVLSDALLDRVDQFIKAQILRMGTLVAGQR